VLRFVEEEHPLKQGLKHNPTPVTNPGNIMLKRNIH